MYRKFRWLIVLGVATVLGLGSQADAQRFGGRGFGGPGPGGFGRGGGGKIFQTQRESVQQELGLNEDQLQQIREVLDAAREDNTVRELFSNMREASDEEREQIQEQIRQHGEAQQKKQDEALAKILSPEQIQRLEQLYLQSLGTSAFQRDEIAAELKLTDEQKQKMEALREASNERRDKVREELRAGTLERDQIGERYQEIQQQLDGELTAVLTPEQQQQWQAKLGPPPADAAPGSTPVASSAPASQPNATVQPATAVQPPVRAGSIVAAADGTPLDEPAVASFATPSGKNGDALPKTFSFTFQHTPWADVLKMYADATGMTLDLAHVPEGSFNYYDNREYTAKEVLNVLNGYLLQQGYIIVQRDNFLHVRNLNDPVPPNLVPDVATAELDERASNELVRVLIPVEADNLDQVGEDVKKLLGPQGEVVPVHASSSLAVTGLARNVRQAIAMLNMGSLGSSELTFRVFPLEHIPATTAESLVRDLFGLPARGVLNVSAGSSDSRSSRDSGRDDPRSRFTSRFGGFDRDRNSRSSSREPSSSSSAASTPAATAANSATSKIQLAVDDRTNSLLVRAPSKEMKMLEEAVKAIDVGESRGGGNFVRRPANDEPYLEMYQLRSADPTEVTKTLGVLYPGAVVNEDGRARRIHIYGTPEVHREISALVAKMDGIGGGGTEVAVVSVGHLDPLAVSVTLQSLFTADGTGAPSIQPDALGRKLVIRGSASQVTQIKQVLTGMGIDPNGSGGDGLLQRGPVRTVNLGGRDPGKMIEVLERLWRASNDNPLQVMERPEGGPIRDQRVPGTQPLPFPERTIDEPVGEGASRPPLRSPVGARPGIGPQSRNEADIHDDSGRVEGPAVNDADPRVTQREIAVPSKLSQLATGLADRFQIDTSTATPGSVRLVAQADGNESSGDEFDAAPPSNPAGAAAQPQRAYDDGPTRRQVGPQAPGKAPILLRQNGGELLIVSEDQEALDRLEMMIQSLAQSIPAETQWTVFYLRAADATDAAQMLGRLFPSSSVTATASSSSGSFFGDFTGGISAMSRGLADATGLSDLGTGPQTLRILPEPRSNAIFVTGPPHQVQQVEDVLRILDASELPTNLRDRAPRYIMVEYGDAAEIAQIVKDVYKPDMEPPQAQNNNDRNNPFAQALGGRGGSNNRGGAPIQPEIRLTLGIDAQNNAIIVSCNDAMFREIEELVYTLDKAAFDANRTVRVVPLANANSATVQQTLTALMPKVKVSTSGGSSSSSSSASGNNNSSSGSRSSSSSSSEGDMRERFRQMMQERSGGGDRGSSRFGGGSPFGGSRFGGSRGSDRGGSGRSSSRGR